MRSFVLLLVVALIGAGAVGGGEGALQVVGDRQDLEEQGLARQAGLALALFGGAAAEVGEVGGGALMGGDLLVPLQQGGGERIELGRPLLGCLGLGRRLGHAYPLACSDSLVSPGPCA